MGKVEFLPVEGSPPNQTGWTSQSLLAIIEENSPYDNSWLHYDTPTKIASFVIETVNDPSFAGLTVACLDSGMSDHNGASAFGDSIALTEHNVIQHFSPIHFTGGTGGCSYVAGDANNSGGYNGLDITYGVNYFKGGLNPPYECECTPGNSWFVAGDVNSSCSYNGLDITYGVNYFKGGSGPLPCADCLPQ